MFHATPYQLVILLYENGLLYVRGVSNRNIESFEKNIVFLITNTVH